MMKFLSSAPALALASAAALSLTATPVMARHWQHDRGIDGGDVLAGVLILGGIAAVASAASKSNRDREARDYRYPDARYPQSGYPQGQYPDDRTPTDQDYRDWRTQRDSDGGYAAPQSDDRYGGTDRRVAGDMDEAVDTCTGEIERGERRIDSVDGVNREADGWRVEGQLEDGRSFSCTAGADGRIRRATVDGRALI